MSFEELVKKYSKVEKIYDDEAILVADEDKIDYPYNEDTGKPLFYTDEGSQGVKYLREILRDFGCVLGFSDHPFDLFQEEELQAYESHIRSVRSKLNKE